MELKERQKKALMEIKNAMLSPEKPGIAYYALGIARATIEDSLDAKVISYEDFAARGRELIELRTSIRALEDEVKSLKKENTALKMDGAYLVKKSEEPKTLQQFCEEKKEQLKHDIIAEEEATYYLHRAYLKDEICKRFPKTNVMIKKILFSHNITNIEEFYEFFTNPSNWYATNEWGISFQDRDKLHNLYITLCEESGCLADEKYQSYIHKITGSETKRIGNAIGSAYNIFTKSQLRYLIKNIEKEKFLRTRGVNSDTLSKIYDYVLEELSFHMV